MVLLLLKIQKYIINRNLQYYNIKSLLFVYFKIKTLFCFISGAVWLKVLTVLVGILIICFTNLWLKGDKIQICKNKKPKSNTSPT